MDFFYSTLGLNGKAFDKSLIDLLDLKSHHKVLEIGAGTGRHSKFIINKLDKNNIFYASDISSNMLNVFRSKIKRKKISFSLINASSLPFPNGTFDRVFHFGGLNNFGNITKAFKEMTRVTKIGGTIVVGDEGIAPWLKNSIFGKMLTNSNPLFNNKIPIEHLPDNARNVSVKYIANGSFYIIKYNVDEGLPYLNTSIEFPGQRGGNYTTRLFGNLEGVSLDTKNLMEKAAKKSGKSFHKWLEDTINERIKIDLK